MNRANYRQTSPDIYKSFLNVNKALDASGLDHKLRALVELRVSQLNGCVFCVSKHTDEARALGEDQSRLDALPVWHEARDFSDTERAALQWAESLTFISRTRAPDADYAAMQDFFSEKEIVELSFAVAMCNAFNRIAAGFRMVP